MESGKRKRFRLAEFRDGGSHVSYSGLASVLNHARRNGVPEHYSRGTQYRERKKMPGTHSLRGSSRPDVYSAGKGEATTSGRAKPICDVSHMLPPVRMVCINGEKRSATHPKPSSVPRVL